MLTGAKDWAHPVAIGVLAALLPWELARTGRRTLTEVIWWITAVMIALVAVARRRTSDIRHRRGLLHSGVGDFGDAPPDLLGGRGEDQGRPTPTANRPGALAAWLAVVPSSSTSCRPARAGDAAGALVLLATVPLLVVAAIVYALRDRPGRFHGVAHDVIGWLLL